MTELEIMNEIENSKTKEWNYDMSIYFDNPKYTTTLAVAGEMAILIRSEGYEYMVAGVEFDKYLNQTSTRDMKRWYEVVEHNYLSVVIEVIGIGAIKIYQDVKGNICLDLIKAFSKGNGPILMKWFLDTIDRVGVNAVTIPTCIEEVLDYKEAYIKAMGLRKWAMNFGFKSKSNKTPKLYYTPNNN